MNKQIIETNVVKPKITIFENDQEYRLISLQSEMELDDRINKLTSYMSNNSGYGKSESEKDILYADSKELWKNYAEVFRDVEYSFYLNRRQYQYLTDLLLKFLEYDVNSLFVAIDLTNLLKDWYTKSGFTDDKTIKPFSTDGTEITYIYHLISKHKVKGLNESSYRFSEILKRIGDISKVISYYDTHAKSLSEDIKKWVASFEDEITENNTENVNIEPLVAESKTKQTKKQKNLS